LLETGANSGTWGTATNVNLGDAVLGEAITGQATVDFATDADVTITLTDSATTQAARNLRLNITESSTGIGSVRNLILGSGCQIEKFYLINNTGTGAKTVKNTSGTGISVPAGKATLVYNNGTNVVDAASYFTSLTLGSALPITSGGTGSTSTTFVNLASNVTGTLPANNGGTGVANNAASTLAISGNFATTLTVSGNTGVTLPTTGTLATLAGSETLTNKTINGSNNTVTNISLTAGVTGTLPVANGGTGLTAGTSGGVLAYTAAGTLASSAALTANKVVIGGGAGVAPSTTALLGTAAAVTTGDYIQAVGYADTVTALGNTGTAINLDLTSGNVFSATLNGNATITLRFPVATGASSFTLILSNDATPSRTVAFAASGGTFKFPGGAASLSRTTTANAIDVWFFFTPDGGTTYFGSIPMKNLTT